MTSDIESFVSKYLEYWDKCDIISLMSMYAEDARYHDMPAGDIIEYPDLKKYFENLFSKQINQRIKLKETTVVEGNSAFVHWTQHFRAKDTGRDVTLNGVELIVFTDGRIQNVHEFYEGESVPVEIEVSSTGSHVDKMTKLGLTDEMMKVIAGELSGYLDNKKPYLNPDLTLATVASDMGYTRNQISFVINHEVGRTFYELVNSKRIDHAIIRMAENVENLSILEIGFDAGFNSVSGFYNAFKKQTSKTPAQYSRSLK